MKQIYDSYDDLQVVISGSSILDIYKGLADLSRRVPIYHMQGLSFREYLYLFHQIEIPAYPLEDILAHKAHIPDVDHPLPLFQDYLRKGYYPFGKDEEFEMELMQVINQTMEIDIPQHLQANISLGRKLKSLLMVVAKSVPFKPVMQRLANATGISRNEISSYLIYMEKAGMIAQLRDTTGGIRGLGKVEKLYLDNTNLIYALSPDKADIGNVRETFFMNQTRVLNDVVSSPISDFEIDGKTFEIGNSKVVKARFERYFSAASRSQSIQKVLDTALNNLKTIEHESTPGDEDLLPPPSLLLPGRASTHPRRHVDLSGAPRKKRQYHCSICGQSNHTAPRCPQALNKS